MYRFILLIALLGYLPSIPAAPAPVECTNYPGYTVGRQAPTILFVARTKLTMPCSLIGKQRAPTPSIFAYAGKETRWCREGSTMYIYFSPPEEIGFSYPFTQTVEEAFGELFALGFNSLKRLPAADANETLTPKYKFDFSSGVNTLGLYASSTTPWPFSKLLISLEIFQNFLYVSRLYGSFYITVMDGNTQLGVLELE